MKRSGSRLSNLFSLRRNKSKQQATPLAALKTSKPLSSPSSPMDTPTSPDYPSGLMSDVPTPLVSARASAASLAQPRSTTATKLYPPVSASGRASLAQKQPRQSTETFSSTISTSKDASHSAADMYVAATDPSHAPPTASAPPDTPATVPAPENASVVSAPSPAPTPATGPVLAPLQTVHLPPRAPSRAHSRSHPHSTAAVVASPSGEGSASLTSNPSRASSLASAISITSSEHEDKKESPAGANKNLSDSTETTDPTDAADSAPETNGQKNDKVLQEPPRAPTPVPQVDPAMKRLGEVIPTMSHLILRYARSNTGMHTSSTTDAETGAPCEPGTTKHSLFAAPSSRAPPRRQREKRTYTRGLAAVVSSSAPVLLATLLHYLEIDDVVELSMTCRSIRETLNSALGAELVLHRFLGPIGYQTWAGQLAVLDAASANGPAAVALLPRLGEEPVALTALDVMNYSLANEIRYEYLPLTTAVKKGGVDSRWPRLARCTTRAHNRVLARLRAQPHYDPSPRDRVQARVLDEVQGTTLGPLLPILRHGPLGQHAAPPHLEAQSERSVWAWQQLGFSRQHALRKAAPKKEALTFRVPWRPGRAPVWRVWVPVANAGGWLEDDDLALAEGELSRSGVRGHAKADHLMAEGDVVWDIAVGAERNEGKFIYDGTFIRYVSREF